MKRQDWFNYLGVTALGALACLVLGIENGAAHVAVVAWGYTIVCAINRRR